MGKFKNINDLQSDEEAEKDGIDLAFGNSRFVTITRSGSSNRKYKTVLSRIFKPYTSTTGIVTTSDDEASLLMQEVYAEAIVVGWRGFKDGADKDVPFNKENCMELFKEAPEIFDIVQKEAARFSNFARRDVAKAGKE